MRDMLPQIIAYLVLGAFLALPFYLISKFFGYLGKRNQKWGQYFSEKTGFEVISNQKMEGQVAGRPALLSQKLDVRSRGGSMQAHIREMGTRVTVPVSTKPEMSFAIIKNGLHTIPIPQSWQTSQTGTASLDRFYEFKAPSPSDFAKLMTTEVLEALEEFRQSVARYSGAGSFVLTEDKFIYVTPALIQSKRVADRVISAMEVMAKILNKI